MTEKQIREALRINYRWGEKKFDEFFRDHTGEWTDEDYNRAAAASEKLYINTYEADRGEVAEAKNERMCGTCTYHKMDKATGEYYCTCKDCDCYTVHTDKKDGEECPDWEGKEKRNEHKKSR